MTRHLPWLVTAALLAIGAAWILLLSGCASTAPPQMASADLKTVAETIENLNQKIDQTQTQNFQLDERRAQVEEARNRDMMRAGMVVLGLIVGLAILGFLSPSLARDGMLRKVLIAVAVALLCGPLTILLLWPF